MDGQALTTFLRTGLASCHAMTAGPMQEVVLGLSKVDDADVQAIVAYFIAYFVAIMGQPAPERQASRRRRAQGPLPDDGSAGARLYDP